MGRAFEIRLQSSLRASPEEVWAHASTMDGVNEELAPWVRMSVPPAARGRSLAAMPTGRVAFASWLLLLGVLPFDRHRLRLEEVDPEARFLERSSSLLQALWEHERRVEPEDGGTRVTDRLRVRPRLPLAALLTRPVVAALFAHRHRRLKRRFGAR
jgi:ligand-binding SRPBCC domain-containing protein